MTTASEAEAYLASPEYLYNDGQFRVFLDGSAQYNHGYDGWVPMERDDPGWRSLAKRLASLLKPFRVRNEEENAHPWLHAPACSCRMTVYTSFRRAD
jgi:hypothetical protein